MNDLKSKKILYAWFDDYYLFGYGFELIDILLINGFDVTVLLKDYKVAGQLSSINKKAKIKIVPSGIRILSNRSNYILIRILFWIASRFYVERISKNYDFAIVPWDNRILWYLISQKIPSLTVHNTTNFIDLNLMLSHERMLDRDRKKLTHKILIFIQNLCGIKLLPEINNIILKYSKFWIIDKIMGKKSINNIQGFSGIRYLTVTGDEIKKTYVEMGVGIGKSKTKIIVVGNPSYDKLKKLDLNIIEKEKIKIELNIPFSKKIYSLFLSPSCFSISQMEEILLVIDTVNKLEINLWFLIKFHPKTSKDEKEKLKAKILNSNVTYIEDYTDEILNLRIILISDCLLQKQGTVGYIAMLKHVPIISYNLLETNYFDDMYERIGGSFHSKNIDELVLNIALYQTEFGKKEMIRKQNLATKSYCNSDLMACDEISKIIENYFKESLVLQ
jgi:hypothetical protein